MQSSNRPEWEVPIPEEWLAPVLWILRQGKFGREIIWPTGVRNRWEADTLGTCVLLEEVRHPLIDALSEKGVIGMLEPRLPEPGVAYAFHYFFKVGDHLTRFYGKINLLPNKIKIKLLSTHLPDPSQGDRL